MVSSLSELEASLNVESEFPDDVFIAVDATSGDNLNDDSDAGAWQHFVKVVVPEVTQKA